MERQIPQGFFAACKGHKDDHVYAGDLSPACPEGAFEAVAGYDFGRSAHKSKTL